MWFHTRSPNRVDYSSSEPNGSLQFLKSSKSGGVAATPIHVTLNEEFLAPDLLLEAFAVVTQRRCSLRKGREQPCLSCRLGRLKRWQEWSPDFPMAGR